MKFIQHIFRQTQRFMRSRFYITRKLRVRSLLLMAFASITLSGCLVPEKFESKVDFEKDGGYTFTFDGVMAFAPALMAGKLSSSDEATLIAEAKKYKGENGYKTFEYIGNARYRVSFAEKLLPDDKGGPTYYDFPKGDNWIVRIRNLGSVGGRITVEIRSMSPSDVAQLKQIGIKPSGAFAVKNNGLTVLEENSDSRKIFGGYEWNFTQLNKRPRIELVADPIVMGGMPVIENNMDERDARLPSSILYCLDGNVTFIKKNKYGYFVEDEIKLAPSIRKCKVDDNKTLILKSKTILKLGEKPVIVADASNIADYCNGGRVYSFVVEGGKVLRDKPSKIFDERCELDKKLTRRFEGQAHYD